MTPLDPQTLHPEPDDRGTRLDQFLARRLGPLTRSQIQALNRSGSVLIDGRREKSGYRIRGGEVVEVALRIDSPAPLQPVHIPLQIVYQDDDLAVVEKPAGLTVHPGAGTREQTLAHALLFHFPGLSGLAGEGRPGIVHRLDKWTSGLLVVAKNDWTRSQLSAAFQNRRVRKEYSGLVHGVPKAPSGEVLLHIARHSSIRTRMSAAATGRGRSAFTSYRITEAFAGFALLSIGIKTGRTHQIRVHLAAIGHPVVGDGVYGERAFKQFVMRFGDPGRYFLHAALLAFDHPRTGEALEFRSELPEDLRRLLEIIKYPKN